MASRTDKPIKQIWVEERVHRLLKNVCKRKGQKMQAAASRLLELGMKIDKEMN